MELNKEQIQFACTNGHLLVNEAMHHNDNFEDALSGTTAISAFVQGRRNRITISNVGDSRAILGKRIEKPIEGATAADGTSNPVVYRAQSLSHDQTPYRKSERKRIRECGARILSLDQIEGLEPVGPDDDYGDDFDPGEQIDEDGDPPRVWHPDMDYPGTAFTRSLGDSLAEDLGVIAEPEIVTRELEEGDEIIVLASDGVFEFLTNQSVIDICAKFVDPVEACQAVISEAYELWLQYELRTDDITMICIFIDGIEKDSDDLRTSIARQSIKDLHKDVPDNFAMDTLPTKSDSNKMNKRLTEMKQLLEESLLDTPNEGQKFDIRKTFNEKTAEEKERLSQVVKGSVMLQSMTPEQLDLIYGLMQPVDVSEGEWVIRQGEDGERFYIVDEGKFEVRISSEPAGRGPVTGDGGKVVHVYEGSIEKKLHPSFGELALLYSAPRAASIVAQTDGKLWALDRAALKSVMLDNAEKKGLVSILRSIEELGKFKDEEIEDFASVMQEVSFNPGSMITTTEKAGTALYILSKGTCSKLLKSTFGKNSYSSWSTNPHPYSLKSTIEIALENEDESMSSILQKLDYFGQETIVEGRYLATVEALTDVKCWKLEKDAIEYSMKKLQAVREGRSTLE